MNELIIGLSLLLIASVALNYFQYKEMCDVQGECHQLRDELNAETRRADHNDTLREMACDEIEKLKDAYAITAARAVHAERDFRNVRKAHAELLNKIAAGQVVSPQIITMFTNKMN